MSALEILESAQFVVDQEGRPSAEQIGIEAWELLLDWLEDLEDRVLVKDALPRLQEGPKKARALSWEAVRAEAEVPGFRLRLASLDESVVGIVSQF